VVEAGNTTPSQGVAPRATLAVVADAPCALQRCTPVTPKSLSAASPTGALSSTTPSHSTCASGAPPPVDAGPASTPSRTMCSCVPLSTSGGRSSAEGSPPDTKTSSLVSTHRSGRPLVVPPTAEKTGVAASASTQPSSMGAVLGRPGPSAAVPVGGSSLMTPAASSARSPPLPPRRSRPPSTAKKVARAKTMRKGKGANGGGEAVTQGKGVNSGPSSKAGVAAGAAISKGSDGAAAKVTKNADTQSAGSGGMESAAAAGQAAAPARGRHGPARVSTSGAVGSGRRPTRCRLAAELAAASVRVAKKSETEASTRSTETVPKTSPSSPASGDRRTTLSHLASKLAATSVRAAKELQTNAGKWPAEAKPKGASSPPPKRSWRLANKLHAVSGVTGTRSVPALDWAGVPNRAPCMLLSELGVHVASARLVKDQKSFHKGWVDEDFVIVQVENVLDAFMAYPWHKRYPLPGTGRAAVDLETLIGSAVVWSKDMLSLTGT